MPIKLLHHKSYHVYNSANIERVKRDEAAARAKEEQEDELLRHRDREQRIEILRRRQRGEAIDNSKENSSEEKRQEATDTDKAIDRAIAATSAGGRNRARNIDDELAAARATLKLAERRTSSETAFRKGGHINFFEELERAESEGTDPNSGRQKKELQPQTLRNMRLDKPAEELAPWYATLDMQSTKERVQSEKERERQLQFSTKSKASLDPLTGMQNYLSRKAEVDLKRRNEALNEPWRTIERGSSAYYAGQSKRIRQNDRTNDLDRRTQGLERDISHREPRDGDRESLPGLHRRGRRETVTKLKSNNDYNEMQRLIREQEAREEREQREARELLRSSGTAGTVLVKR
ncbi:hypothetical protein POJ06DRAFT_130982 [Lipomyces tetrasporus]|uniref:Pre-mRNA-splicing factor CWC25 n=1 Tax=Lipomyces tetrasporus TaxID=54092 RepID=A0AAD7QPU3_9ASCO|nr:uncharacterized protein POJ06DRAFT_130982 [Lipomyces tetrasporus]KAJ8099215.1 hypothetical protein POJ06DRAFT_130982 [Lipomyces tetrasporus]